MRRFKIILTICIICAIAAFIVSLFFGKSKGSDNSISSAAEEMEISLSSNDNTLYTDFDKDYNYIKNPIKLDSIECPLGGVMTIGDLVNEYYQGLGFKGEALVINLATSDKIDYMIQIYCESATSKRIKCTYNVMDEAWKIEEI